MGAKVEVISSIKGVTKVVPQTTLDCPNLLEMRPDVVHGDDWKSGVQSQVRQDVIETLAEWNGELIEVPYTANISSTSLQAAMKEIGTTPDVRRIALRRMLAAKRYCDSLICTMD